MSYLDLSIIIVNWNTSALLSRAHECVYRTVQRTSYEVIVVDNGSTDDSIEVLRTRFLQARAILNLENVGFARANNQATEIAQGRYILLLNSDAFAHEGAIDHLVEFMDAHPEAGAAGC